jgi:hypothetical protein
MADGIIIDWVFAESRCEHAVKEQMLPQKFYLQKKAEVNSIICLQKQAL